MPLVLVLPPKLAVTVAAIVIMVVAVVDHTLDMADIRQTLAVVAVIVIAMAANETRANSA